MVLRVAVGSGSVDTLAEVRSVVVEDNDRFNLTGRKPCMGARRTDGGYGVFASRVSA